MLDSLSLDWSCDWPQLWGKWNWQTFRFIHASVEIDGMLGQFELDAAVLGFGLRFVWVFDHETELRRDLENHAWLENCNVSIPFAEYEEYRKWRESQDGTGREKGA